MFQTTFSSFIGCGGSAMFWGPEVVELSCDCGAVYADGLAKGDGDL